MKNILSIVALVSAVPMLSGCYSAGGAAGALASSAVGGAVSASSQRARLARQDCDTLQREASQAGLGYINPLNAPATASYIATVKDVARQKGCAFVTTTETQAG